MFILLHDLTVKLESTLLLWTGKSKKKDWGSVFWSEKCYGRVCFLNYNGLHLQGISFLQSFCLMASRGRTENTDFVVFVLIFNWVSSELRDCLETIVLAHLCWTHWLYTEIIDWLCAETIDWLYAETIDWLYAEIIDWLDPEIILALCWNQGPVLWVRWIQLIFSFNKNLFPLKMSNEVSKVWKCKLWCWNE